MLRPWGLLLTLAGLLWAVRLARWAQYGFFMPLTVGDMLREAGLSLPAPPATPLGDVLAALLATDGGLFCLLLAMAVLIVEAVAPRHRGSD